MLRREKWFRTFLGILLSSKAVVGGSLLRFMTSLSQKYDYFQHQALFPTCRVGLKFNSRAVVYHQPVCAKYCTLTGILPFWLLLWLISITDGQHHYMLPSLYSLHSILWYQGSQGFKLDLVRIICFLCVRCLQQQERFSRH